jgi:hypothetical protein
LSLAPKAPPNARAQADAAITARPAAGRANGPVANPDPDRRRASAAPLSCFVRGGKSEAVGEQLVLLAHGPSAGKAEALAQPQHRLEAADRAPGRVERAEAVDPRYVCGTLRRMLRRAVEKTTGNLTLKRVRKRCLEIKCGERLEGKTPR